ncbi:hypothetical protein LCGC14_0417110 [marine sediment metagenome]|uniref:Uncharacterized protein n=1 Tax=marine sediment metagenome TaxID=412755 RepID=A0A0F9TAA3_9ZZZZ
MSEKGNCPEHGEFVLMDGCAQCLADQKAERKAPPPPPLPGEGPDAWIEKGFPPPPPPITAIQTIVPDQDAEVLNIHSEILKARDRAVTMKVETHEDANAAVTDLSCIKALRQNLEVKRRSFIDPHRAYVSEVNEAFKIFEAPIIEADKSLRGKWTTFKLKQEAIRQNALEAVEAQRIADAKAKEVREATGEIVPKQTEAQVVVPDASTRTHTDMGTAGMVMIKKWAVADENKIPRSYMEPNTKMIGKVIRAGGDIPGIRVWDEPSSRITAKGGE